MVAVVIIPARMGSMRFPGKPLVLLDGRPMIEHVWRAAHATGMRAIVATDSPVIAHVAGEFGGEVVLTSDTCPNGTARCAEAAEILNLNGDTVVINLQGDEPMILPEQIKAVGQAVADGAEVATLMSDASDEEVADPMTVKVSVNADSQAVRFSRTDISRLAHTGVYGYRADTLRRLAAMKPSPAAIAESLEQVTWVDAGVKVKCCYTAHRTIGIDTPQDLHRVEKIFKQNHGPNTSPQD